MIEVDNHDIETVLTWYEHIPSSWKMHNYSRDSKVFERLRQKALDAEAESRAIYMRNLRESALRPSDV